MIKKLLKTGFLLLALILVYALLLLAGLRYAAAQYTIGPSSPVTPPPSGGVTDENYYDNVDDTCRNMVSHADGPAALPDKCYNTAMENTPAGPAFYCVLPAGQPSPPSCIGSVSNFATVSAAFNAIGNGTIPCGSIIKIVATSDGTPQGQQNVYDESRLTYPARVCNAQHWIWVTTDMLPQLPPQGNRISPAWLGVPSLPGRPPYAQPAVPGIYMPKIRPTVFQTATLVLTSGVNVGDPATSYVRFIGLEFVQPVAGAAVCTGRNCKTGWQYVIVDGNCGPAAANRECSNHTIFDRIIVTADDHTGNSTVTICTGMQTTGKYVALINSYVFQITGEAGYCEPKTIGNGNTISLTQGPYKFFNNFMEGGAENYFFGGGVSYSNANNIQFRRSHMFTPWTLWMPMRSLSYLGVPIMKKNLGESKAAVKILLEGNIYEYAWYGPDINNKTISDQFATAVLLHAANGCITCAFQDHSEDMVFRYNLVRHAVRAAGLDNSGCGSSKLEGCGPTPPGRTAAVLQRITVHDNVFDDISVKWYTKPYGGSGYDGNGFQLLNPLQSIGRNAPLNSMFMDHNTVINSSYSQDLRVVSITVVGTTATLTTDGPVPFVGRGFAPTISGSKKAQVFASCPGFNQYITIGTVLSLDPVTFTYPGAPAGQTCEHGFVSLLGPRVGGSLSLNEGASDLTIASVWEIGNTAFALVSGWNGLMIPCAGANLPVNSGCQAAMQVTIWGVASPNSCYNNKQSSCGNDGTQTTPATWNIVGTAYCNGVGTGGDFIGVTSDITKCRASGQRIFAFNHIQSGLNTVNPSYAWFSFWPTFNAFNYGPSPNQAWPGIVYTNNISGGRGAQMNSGAQPPGCSGAGLNTTAGMLTNCGVVATSGSGAYVYRCNVLPSWPMISGSANPTDTLPPNNSDTPDRTFQSVGFVNFNYDGLGMGVPDLDDLVLAPTSPFKGGLPGCDGKDPGADIPLVKEYTAGVE